MYNRNFYIFLLLCIAMILSCVELEHSNPLDPEYKGNNNVTNTAPTAAFSVTPATGNVNTTFAVDASTSSDTEDQADQLQVRWDWENDGTWDTNYSTTKTASHQYTTIGTKTIKMQVQDTGGLTAEHTETVTVTAGNAAPTASFTVTPTSGDVNTTFVVDASASSDTEDQADQLQVRWDWENDGTWDTSYSTTKTASHQYATTGTKTIKMQVQDTGGLTAEHTETVTVAAGNAAPTASFSVTPTSGDVNTTFDVDASASSDTEDQADQLQVRWDWENDGTWDTNYSTTKTASHQYSTSGSKTIKCEVQDTGGLTAEHTETVTVTAASVSYGSMTGNDGKTYKTVVIGGQEWMAENLQETQYRDGSAIPLITDNSAWTALSTGGRCAYDNDEDLAAVYGYIYNWYAVDDARNIAPAGWHVPTHEEFTALIDYLGGVGEAGGKLKEAGTAHWIDPNTGATDESHFTGLPAGYRSQVDGGYGYMGQLTYYWSASLQFSTNAYTRRLDVGSAMCPGYAYVKNLGYSVRLIKD